MQAPCQARLQRAIPPANTRPVRVVSQDERRRGLLTVRRRPAHGVPPLGAIQHVFEGGYVYGAGAPATGERFFLARPSLHADRWQRVLEACAQAFPDRLTIVVLDHRGAHTAPRWRWPDTVRAVWLPPSCPALHPLERRWRDLKEDLAWPQCVDGEAQPRYVAG